MYLSTPKIYWRDQWVPIGTHIRMKRPTGIYHHAIIVSGCASSLGPTMVMHNAKITGVTEDEIETVVGSDPVEIVAYPKSPEHAYAIVERAYSQKNTPWVLLNRNCEHYATFCMDAVPRSHQVDTVLSFAVIAALGYLLIEGTE